MPRVIFAMQPNKPRQRRHKYLERLLLALTIVLSAWLLFVFLTRSRLYVVLENSGPNALHSVVVHVPGRSYSLGDLPPGAIRKIRIEPGGEGGVTIELVDGQGNLKTLEGGGYFGPEYSGTIWITLDADKIIDRRDNTTLMPW